VNREAAQILNYNLAILATPVSFDQIEPQPQHISESETVPPTEEALCIPVRNFQLRGLALFF
jgi:hypothetical protein